MKSDRRTQPKTRLYGSSVVPKILEAIALIMVCLIFQIMLQYASHRSSQIILDILIRGSIYCYGLLPFLVSLIREVCTFFLYRTLSNDIHI